jgi:hypothetical protein
MNISINATKVTMFCVQLSSFHMLVHFLHSSLSVFQIMTAKYHNGLTPCLKFHEFPPLCSLFLPNHVTTEALIRTYQKTSRATNSRTTTCHQCAQTGSGAHPAKETTPGDKAAPLTSTVWGLTAKMSCSAQPVTSPTLLEVHVPAGIS